MSDRLQLRVKRQSAWREIPRSGRSASVEISTGNPRCAGHYLAAQLEWAVQHFDRFRFAIGDTLQKYNYVVFGHPLHGNCLEDWQASTICHEEGKQWLGENKDVIEEILAGREYVVRHWDQLLAESECVRNLHDLEKLHAADKQIFDLVRLDVVGYVGRRHNAAVLTDEQWSLLDRHVLEELAVYQYQAEFGNHVSLYPGSNQLLLRPKYFADTNLPRSLKMRNYVSFDIKQDLGRRSRPETSRHAR